MLLRRFTDIRPKELTRDMRGFFNSLSRVLLQVICTSKAPVGCLGLPGLSAGGNALPGIILNYAVLTRNFLCNPITATRAKPNSVTVDPPSGTTVLEPVTN